MKICAIVLLAVAVAIVAFGRGGDGLDAAAVYMGAAMVAAIAGLLFVLAKKRSEEPK